MCEKVGWIDVTILLISQVGGLTPTHPITRLSQVKYTIYTVTSIPDKSPLLLSTRDVPTPDHGRSSLLDPAGTHVINTPLTLIKLIYFGYRKLTIYH